MSGLDGTVVLAHVNTPDVASKDESQWMLTVSTQAAPMTTIGPIRDCAVYVFRSIGKGQAGFFIEYVADANGNLSESTAAERQDHETQRALGLTQGLVPEATALESLHL